jgi:hypothetical protein
MCVLCIYLCAAPFTPRLRRIFTRLCHSGQTLLKPSLAASEGLSPTGTSRAEILTNGTNEIAATTDAVIVITTTIPAAARRRDPAKAVPRRQRGSVPDRDEQGRNPHERHKRNRCHNRCSHRDHYNHPPRPPEGETLLKPSFAASEGLSPTGTSRAEFLTNGTNEIAATTDAVIVITTTIPRRCQRERP